MRRILLGAGVLALLAFLFVLALGSGGYVACGRVPARIRGTVVDAETGAPVEGASLLSLLDPGIASDPEGLAQRRRIAEGARGRTEDGHLSYATAATARTDAGGAFEMTVAIGTSCTTDWLGRVASRSRGTAHEASRALLVEREGYAALVHLTKDAAWVEKQEGEIVGTLEVGAIRLARAP
ncbi:MAG: hypothetical protein L6Q95_05000 [Planctomycetes bacterium]|nr:hypothetical protein [Planctomycetota bacterium]